MIRRSTRRILLGRPRLKVDFNLGSPEVTNIIMVLRSQTVNVCTVNRRSIKNLNIKDLKLRT